MDMLGRVILAEASEDRNKTNYTIKSRSVYEQMGRNITYGSRTRETPVATTDGWIQSNER